MEPLNESDTAFLLISLPILKMSFMIEVVVYLEAVKGNANSQGLLGQLYHFGQGGLPKSSKLALIWYWVSMANGNTAIEGLYNGAAFVFNEEQLKEIEAKATTCFSSQYKNCE